MKAFGVYGEKTFFILYLLAAILSLVSGTILFFFAWILKIDWVYYPVFFFGAAFLYLLYLAFYEGVFRYEALRKSQGKIVRVLLSHIDPLTGVSSLVLLGVVNYETKAPVVGKLVGTFGPIFCKKFREGDVVSCYRVKTGELLVIADQKNPERYIDV